MIAVAMLFFPHVIIRVMNLPIIWLLKRGSRMTGFFLINCPLGIFFLALSYAFGFFIPYFERAFFPAFDAERVLRPADDMVPARQEDP